MIWAYGVTTVPERRDNLLPRTLVSLRAGGFGRPRLFVDDYDGQDYEGFGLECTFHKPRVRVFGNWVLALWELYVRRPDADRYAIFQDDLVCSRNLRKYLEHCEYPEAGYWNCYTFPANEKLKPKGMVHGWYNSNQRGLSALALVFSRPAVIVLLGHQHIVERPQDPRRGWRAIDGGISTAFRKAGWVELVHYPSLVQHTGQWDSAMGNKPHPQSESFRGEAFDLMSLVRKP